MVITKQVQEILDATPPGKVLTIADFNVLPEYQPALVKALSRLVAEGSICKIAKGRYYKPKQTVFGTLKPPVAEVVKDLLERNGKPIGYMTGTAAFAQLGLTTQITSAITIGTNKYRRPMKRGEYSVSFLVQPNAITRENIPLLLILDALKLLREIPATSPDDCPKAIWRNWRTWPKITSRMSGHCWVPFWTVLELTPDNCVRHSMGSRPTNFLSPHRLYPPN